MLTTHLFIFVLTISPWYFLFIDLRQILCVAFYIHCDAWIYSSLLQVSVRIYQWDGCCKQKQSGPLPPGHTVSLYFLVPTAVREHMGLSLGQWATSNKHPPGTWPVTISSVLSSLHCAWAWDLGIHLLKKTDLAAEVHLDLSVSLWKEITYFWPLVIKKETSDIWVLISKFFIEFR